MTRVSCSLAYEDAFALTHSVENVWESLTDARNEVLSGACVLDAGL